MLLEVTIKSPLDSPAIEEDHLNSFSTFKLYAYLRSGRMPFVFKFLRALMYDHNECLTFYWRVVIPQDCPVVLLHNQGLNGRAE